MKNKTEAQVKEMLAISVNLVVRNILDHAIQQTKEGFCKACPTPCDRWCNKATKVTEALINHYLRHKARWN